MAVSYTSDGLLTHQWTPSSNDCAIAGYDAILTDGPVAYGVFHDFAQNTDISADLLGLLAPNIPMAQGRTAFFDHGAGDAYAMAAGDLFIYNAQGKQILCNNYQRNSVEQLEEGVTAVAALGADAAHLFIATLVGTIQIAAHQCTGTCTDDSGVCNLPYREFSVSPTGRSVDNVTPFGAFVYFTTADGTVGRLGIDHDGGAVQTIAENQPPITGLAVDMTGVYWATDAQEADGGDDGRIWWAPFR
jgi:hypothetical protein